MPDTTRSSNGPDPLHAFRAARAESGLRKVRRIGQLMAVLCLVVVLYGGGTLWTSIDEDVSRLTDLVGLPFFLLVLLALVWQAVARAGDRTEMERAARLDQTQLRSMSFAKGEWVGGMVCEESNPLTFALKFNSRSWHSPVTEFLVPALLAVISAVKFSKGDQTWVFFAVLLVLVPQSRCS